MTVLNLAHVPGGIVTVANCGEEAKYKLVQSSTSLRGALDSLVSVAPLNRWRLEKGVVNLIPDQNEPALLNLRIAEFKVKNASNIQDVVHQLLMLPEVQRRLTELHLSEGRTEPGLTDLQRPGSGTGEVRQAFNVHCTNVTLRSALNIIVRTHGYAVWAYTERRCNDRNEFRIDFLVR
jgi:hypothetical protein